MKTLIGIYLTFLKMGAVTFGGGYTMLPILQREVGEGKRWVTSEEVMDFYAVSQGLPGIIAVNVSVFIGYHVRRVPGAVAAALGTVSPCLVIITLIAAFLQNFQDIPAVQHAFSGISVCVIALILNTVLSLWRKGVHDMVGAAVCVAVFVLMEAAGASPILLVLAAAVLGVALQCVLPRLRGKKGGRP